MKATPAWPGHSRSSPEVFTDTRVAAFFVESKALRKQNWATQRKEKKMKDLDDAVDLLADWAQSVVRLVVRTVLLPFDFVNTLLDN